MQIQSMNPIKIPCYAVTTNTYLHQAAAGLLDILREPGKSIPSLSYGSLTIIRISNSANIKTCYYRAYHKYDIDMIVQDDYVYIEIRKGMYNLKEARNKWL